MGAEQLPLFGRDPGADELPSFDGLRRIQLDASSWIDYCGNFVAQHAALFDRVRATLRFRSERRTMYEREVDVPRLFTSLPEDGPVPPLLAAVEAALAERYQASFERIGVALYRSGDDSVAFHRDHMPRDRTTLVAILSLGTPRKLLVRPHGGGASRAFRLGWGDLFVMGGMCQAHWEHGIPKQASAAPRMSCVFRHVYEP
ncbi:MAG TPA: alpha-ketoglutarate-dependent dioxygenase AlkB [Polyangiales bacterium]